MQLPEVVSQIRDAAHNVTYRFLAYRKLTRAEMVTGVRQYLSQQRVRHRRTRNRNGTITIVTIHGATPDL